MNRKLLTAGRHALCALLTLVAASASAQTVVFDSYGPDIDQLEGWPTPITATQAVAVPFALSDTTTLLSLLTTLDGSGSLTLGIQARTAALPSDGPWLHSLLLVDPRANSLLEPSGWTLAAGSYWLVAVGGAGFEGSWQSPTTEPAGPWAFRDPASGWTAVSSSFTGLPGVRISAVSAIPEPSSLLLLVGGAAVLLLRSRHGAPNRQG